MPRPPPRTHERSLLRNPDFVRLWTAESVSQLGSQVSLLALPLLAIKTLHASTFAVGALSAVEFAPFLIVGLPAGVIVDRRRRRPVLMLGDIGRAIALFSIPLAWWLGVLTLAQLFVVVFITGVLTVFFDVAYQSYLPALVDHDQLGDGNAKLEISRSGAQIAGPGLAGALVQIVGAPAAVVADAVSFVLSATRCCSSGAPSRRSRRPSRSGRRCAPRSAKGSATCSATRRCARSPGAPRPRTTSARCSTAVLLVYLVRTLHYSAGVIGLIFMFANIGLPPSAAAARRVERRLRLGRTIWMSILVGQIGGLVVAFSPRHHAFPWIVGGMVLFAAGGTIYNISQVSYRQAITPNRMLGRMNATMRFMVWGTMPLGSLTASYGAALQPTRAGDEAASRPAPAGSPIVRNSTTAQGG